MLYAHDTQATIPPQRMPKRQSNWQNWFEILQENFLECEVKQGSEQNHCLFLIYSLIKYARLTNPLILALSLSKRLFI